MTAYIGEWQNDAEREIDDLQGFEFGVTPVLEAIEKIQVPKAMSFYPIWIQHC